jgi:K+-dependent Na+/Ca+ exchanger-like protein
MLIVWIAALIISFYVLALICEEYFVNSLKQIGRKFYLSSEAAGATLMALGSSAPELSISIIALFIAGNHAQLGAGNIVGSAIFQFLFIIGAIALTKNAVLNYKPFIRDITFYILAVILLIVFFYDGQILFYESLIFILIYIFYVIAVIKWKKIFKYEDKIKQYSSKAKKRKTNIIKKFISLFFPSDRKYFLMFIISIIFISIFSFLLVESAIQIAIITNIPEVIIAIVVIAAGNSIPDLLSSVKTAREDMPDMAVTNAIGSNNFDIMFGLGFPWMLALLLKEETINVDNANLFTTALILLGTVLLVFFLLVLNKWRITKYTGFFLLLLYFIYVTFIIITGITGF